ncbi:MAG: hypothetical protein Q9182_001640 [Xanthomendoza sp. 2 TL-2023]
MAPYQYTPLKKEAKEIRLLTLLPDILETPIHITIKTVVLSDKKVPKFEALSYAWGDPADRLDIFVKLKPSKRDILQWIKNPKRAGPTTLPVTRNLAEALKHLRLEDRPRVFWIDAICVNQQDPEERSNQVLRMPEIYSSARVVVAWLGRESADSSVAMRYLQDLGSKIIVDWGLHTFTAASENHLDPFSEEFIDEVEPTRQLWLSLRNLLSRAWFERLVYALLSLVPEVERFGIRPDYTKSVPEVFENLVLQRLECFSDLALLRYCATKDRTMDMPTWVPDWSVGSEFNNVLESGRADGSARAYARSPSKGTLIATGLCVTVIDQIQDYQVMEIPRDFDYEWAKLFGGLISALIDRGIINSSLDGLPTLCRALCANSFSNTGVPLNQNLPVLEKAVEYLMDCYEWSVQGLTEPPEPYKHFTDSVHWRKKGRVLFTAAEGRFGLAPEAVRKGDKICVILGCPSPLVLRSEDGGITYIVIGVCYLDGIMSGEALLGELPKSWTFVLKYFPMYRAGYFSYLDNDTGETHVEDPRRGPLPAHWRIGSHERDDAFSLYVNDETGEETDLDPRLKPDALKARGVELQEFVLV